MNYQCDLPDNHFRLFEFIGCIVSSYRFNQYTIAVVEELAHASNLVLEVYKLQVKKLKRREIHYFTQVYDMTP